MSDSESDATIGPEFDADFWTETELQAECCDNPTEKDFVFFDSVPGSTGAKKAEGGPPQKACWRPKNEPSWQRDLRRAKSRMAKAKQVAPPSKSSSAFVGVASRANTPRVVPPPAAARLLQQQQQQQQQQQPSVDPIARSPAHAATS